MLSFYFLDVVLRLSYNDCVIWGFRVFFLLKWEHFIDRPLLFLCVLLKRKYTM